MLEEGVPDWTDLAEHAEKGGYRYIILPDHEPHTGHVEDSGYEPVKNHIQTDEMGDYGKKYTLYRKEGGAEKMIVRVCAVLLLALFVVPFGMGEAFISARDKRLVYFGGLFASLTVFEILMLIFHAAMGSLRVMTALWCLLCGAVACMAGANMAAV